MSQHNDGSRHQKPQYYYFYGSTEEGNRSNAATDALLATHATDQDSLVGESLIPTDNEHEEETPVNMSKDLPHVVLLKGDEVKPLMNNRSTNGHSIDSEGAASLGGVRRNGSANIFCWMGGIILGAFLISIGILQVYNQGSLLPKHNAVDAVFEVPFPTVDRSEFGDPISAFMQKRLFHPKYHYKGRDPSREFTFPFPTGAFWTNLVLPATADHGLSYPTAVYPYAYQWSDDVLHISYPAAHRKEQKKAIYDYAIPDLAFGCREGTSSRYIEHFDALSVTLNFNTVSGGSWESYLVQGSPYATIRYKNSFPVVRAFAGFSDVFCPRDEDGAINFDGRRLMFGVCSSQTSSDGKTSVLRGIQFVLQTTDNKYWFVFASEPISLTFDKTKRTTVESENNFNGVLRFAYVPAIRRMDEQATNASATVGSDEYLKVSSSKALQRLIYHAGVYPVSGKVTWSFRPASTSDTSHALVSKSVIGLGSLTKLAHKAPTQASAKPVKSKRLGTIRFDYTTRTFAPKSSGAKSTVSLLMLALPHHAQSLPASGLLDPSEFELSYRSIKGPMTPYLGSAWMYEEVLPSLGFDGDSGSNSLQSLGDSSVRRILSDSLKEDIKISLPTRTEDVYGFGKQSARLAQIAHICKKLLIGSNGTDSVADDVAEVLAQSQRKLSDILERFLTNKVSDSLLFDANLGGLVTSNGLMDSQADYGNGRYNDHHFHYGYLLYACAVMGHLNSSFVEAFGTEVDAVYYDVAHGANLDSDSVNGVFFPVARHKSWFDGHSFASGLFPFGNGKSQESSSEAVNCYYGAYLWSLVRHNAGGRPDTDTSSRTDYARLLLATEIRGARTYWHMSPKRSLMNRTNSVFPQTYTPDFAANFMVGNLGMLDAICSTWFGTKELYVHMINFLPVTAVTGELFSQQYVSDEYNYVLKSQASDVEMAWRGYVVANHAIIDPTSAWQEAQGLLSPQLDSALSKSQVLFWIATRSSFNASALTHAAPASSPNEDRTDSSGSSTSSGGGSCKAAPNCAELGLIGDCCPAASGTYLECCNR